MVSWPVLSDQKEIPHSTLVCNTICACVRQIVDFETVESRIVDISRTIVDCRCEIINALFPTVLDFFFFSVFLEFDIKKHSTIYLTTVFFLNSKNIFDNHISRLSFSSIIFWFCRMVWINMQVRTIVNLKTNHSWYMTDFITLIITVKNNNA